LATLYDARDRRLPDPLRNLDDPKYLAWIVVRYFDLDGDLIKVNTSSLIENVAFADKGYFLHLLFSSTDKLGYFIEYMAIPVPGEVGLRVETLEPRGGDGWKIGPGFSWSPLTEGGYRDAMDSVDRASNC
jgi:hypothetical protein